MSNSLIWVFYLFDVTPAYEDIRMYISLILKVILVLMSMFMFCFKISIFRKTLQQICISNQFVELSFSEAIFIMWLRSSGGLWCQYVGRVDLYLLLHSAIWSCKYNYSPKHHHLGSMGRISVEAEHIMRLRDRKKRPIFLADNTTKKLLFVRLLWNINSPDSYQHFLIHVCCLM